MSIGWIFTAILLERINFSILIANVITERQTGRRWERIPQKKQHTRFNPPCCFIQSTHNLSHPGCTGNALFIVTTWINSGTGSFRGSFQGWGSFRGLYGALNLGPNIYIYLLNTRSCSVIVRVRVVMKRTVVGDND